MELNKGSIIEIGDCNKVTEFLPAGTIFKILKNDEGFINIKDSLIMKSFNVNDKNRISYIILTIKEEFRTPTCYEGYSFSTLNGFKFEIIKIPNHKYGIK